jgi:hypothetical protein
VAFRIGRWVFFAVVLALFPVALGVVSTVTRGDALQFDALFMHGELFLVSTAILGAALAELFSARKQRLQTARLWIGCSAGVVLLSSAAWFADVAAGFRDGSKLDHHTIAIGSVVVFGLAFATGMCCVVVAERAEDVT